MFMTGQGLSLGRLYPPPKTRSLVRTLPRFATALSLLKEREKERERKRERKRQRVIEVFDFD